MENFPRNAVIPTNLILTVVIFFLLTQTNAQTIPKPKPSQRPIPSPINSHRNPKPKSPAPAPSPNNPKQETPKNPKPKPKPDPATSSSPYNFINNFCLSRLLDVQSTFCLKVLRSSPESTKARNNKDLLNIAAHSAIDFGNKTTLLLEKLSEDKTEPEKLKAVVEECLSAYKGFISEYNNLLQEAKSRIQLASFDAELAKNEINRCVIALINKFNNAEIELLNGIALDYTKLTQNIADSISTH